MKVIVVETGFEGKQLTPCVTSHRNILEISYGNKAVPLLSEIVMLA